MLNKIIAVAILLLIDVSIKPDKNLYSFDITISSSYANEDCFGGDTCTRARRPPPEDSFNPCAFSGCGGGSSNNGGNSGPGNSGGGNRPDPSEDEKDDDKEDENGLTAKERCEISEITRHEDVIFELNIGRNSGLTSCGIAAIGASTLFTPLAGAGVGSVCTLGVEYEFGQALSEENTLHATKTRQC